MAVFTNTDYWASAADAPTNCGGRWMEASPGDVLVAHDDPSARRAAALRGCKLVEITTREDGRQVVAGPNGHFPLKGSFPDALPGGSDDDPFVCDVAVFGPPGCVPEGELEDLEANGRAVRVYDDRWDSPFAVGRLEAAPDIVAALRSARVTLAASEDLVATAWAVGGRGLDSRWAANASVLLAMGEAEAEDARRRVLASDSRSARLADVLRAAG